MEGNTRIDGNDLNDLIFILGFDCFGNNIAHSCRPYQGDPYLTYKGTEYIISADSLAPGLNYSVIVEQTTVDTEIHDGVPGIATYATLIFLAYSTAGKTEEKVCPETN